MGRNSQSQFSFIASAANMEFLNKLRGSAEDKVKQKAQDEADKKTDKLQAKATQLKDSANSIRKAKTSAEKLVKEVEIVLGHVVEIGSHAQSADVKALTGVVGSLNASRVVISENLETLKECFENLKQVAGFGEEDADNNDNVEGDKDKDKEKTEESESGLRRIVRVLSDIIGEVTLIADREIPSIVESSEALTEESEAGGVEAATEKAKTLGSIGKDCNDIRKRAMNVKKHVQALKSSSSSDGDEGNGEEDFEGQGKDIKDKDKDAQADKKDPTPKSADKSSSSWWNTFGGCCCCRKRKLDADEEGATRPK